MEDTAYRAIAIVGAGAVLPDAPDVTAFWENVKSGRYSITEVSPDRWDPALYFDPDPKAPDKTYSKIGGWVRDAAWDPMKWHLPIPPRVADAMDDSHKWAVACTRSALEDYGYPSRHMDLDRTAVILGNALAGEKHYMTCLRAYFPEYARELAQTDAFALLPAEVREEIIRGLHGRMIRRFPEITEDTMPGELANCIAGRVANLYNLHGPNYTTDAACASAMAAVTAAAGGLVEHQFDLAITGGIDRNMGVSSFIKFCKIGALSATGSRPYAEGADGFVMGEGAAVLLMKRLGDAERDGDKIYAVLRGIAGSSDGKGKGITAPNPVGQKLAIRRAWENAGLSPATCGLMEGHGTSTRVGDLVETESLAEVLGNFQAAPGSVALGSVKSNFGHLKGAAGAAGLLKATLALRDKVLPPSVNCDRPNPAIGFGRIPLYVNGELKPWPQPSGSPRRAGVSAFGFGGTNFHAVLEEYVPGALKVNGKRAVVAGVDVPGAPQESAKAPLRGALVIGAASERELAARLDKVRQDAERGSAPAPAAPAEEDLRAPERVAIDYTDAADLADKCGKALKALAAGQPAMWKALKPQGLFRGRGAAGKVAFLYTGQGSQYVNMLAPLRASEPIVAETFAEADRIMTPLLGQTLSSLIFVDSADPVAMAKAEDELRQTAITQPAVLATDLALTRLLGQYGIRPDMTMGHSLGEYGALVAAGAMPFADALEAVSARGREMTRVSMADNGRMAAIFAPLEEIERILKTIDGYVVIANLNSKKQAVIGGASPAVDQAVEAFLNAGYNAVPLTVSHAFHTSVVAPAAKQLRQVLERLHFEAPRLPVVTNVTGEFYPAGADAPARIVDILAEQVSSPVQFIQGLHTLYAAGARVFVEVGPKKALEGFVEDVLGDAGDVLALFTNHPKTGDVASFNQALCGLYAAGLGTGVKATEKAMQETKIEITTPAAALAPQRTVPADRYTELGRLFADFLERGRDIYEGKPAPEPARSLPEKRVMITGAALGLPGTERIFDDGNLGRILRGQQFIGQIPERFRNAILDKHVTRLVKTGNGGPSFESIQNAADVIKLAARGGSFDLEHEFGIPAERVGALDRATKLAMAAGIDAMRDAGIPLVMRYKNTTRGTQLPDRWGLPEQLRDDTGVIFASCFPGYDSFAGEISRYWQDKARREQIEMLEALGASIDGLNGTAAVAGELDRRLEELRTAVEREPFVFDRRFILRTLPMGHSQFAEFIGARGPNTQLNAACASTTQAIGVAEDWIRAGRCRRVIVVSADDVTSDNLLEWLGAGFLATGAAATDAVVEEAALPFDRRRHGMLLGMGAAAVVVESAEAAAERGLLPICEVLSTVAANSAFHATRLDVQHISGVMEDLVSRAETRGGVTRKQIAERMVFISHETYTPARGGSASAEINALRNVFGEAADRIVIANTKGFTGHAMGAGIEDVVAVKVLETGCVPPVANFKEVDPELGSLNLSKGGEYPVEYALRLGAGFGSQIDMTLTRRVGNGTRRKPEQLGYAYRVIDERAWKDWLRKASGSGSAELEVARRVLRVKDIGTASKIAEPQPSKVPEPVAPVVKPEPPVVQAVAPPAVNGDPVRDKVLAIVAAKTGYPKDMLAVDLDLEADLGIDTVKQAEVLAAVREEWGIARDDSKKLRDFPTLTHVIRFVTEKRPDLAAEAAPVSAPPVAAAMVASVAAAPVGDPVRDKVLDIVAEKTGYPKEMLDVDLDLEADLGVDTVKQAEVLAAIREIYNIPRDESRKLRDYPTLAHVIRFVMEKRPDLAATAVPAAPTAAQAATGDPVLERVLDIVAEKTGYPKEMLDPDLDLEADLGVDTVKQAEVFTAVREIYQIPRDENRKLRDYPTLAHVVSFVKERMPQMEPVPAAPAAQEAAPPATDAIADKVMAIAAEKTGYPTEMLDLDLDLEADLGIDTVKQAEMFASVRETFQIPRDVSLKLRDFPTLRHVIQFARERHAGTVEVAAVEAVAPRPEPASMEAAKALPRRVPSAVLRPPISACKPTGVDFHGRVIVMPDLGGVADALDAQLRAQGAEVLRIDRALDAAQLTRCVKGWVAEGPVKGVYWLAALDHEGDLATIEPEAWHEALRVRVKALYTTMRALYEQIAAPGTFLVSATRLGGRHGYDDTGADYAMGGAVTGFTKTYKRERPDALVKAVDFEAGGEAAEIAGALVEETLWDNGAVEIGRQGGLRWTVALREQPAEDGRSGMTLDNNTVFLVTGAAGSIVSAITADLAAASGGTFYLLDLTPEPDPNDPDLRRFTTDKDGLKRELFARMQARGERATPAQIEKQMAALERMQAAATAIQAVRAAGGTARYFSVNLTDGAAVAEVVRQIREESGRIDVLLHAAGMERSHFLPDKEPREFDLVFDVKADGWFHLLRAIGDMPLGATVAFSSIAGRFGNGGQADYSSANDLLCKIASSMKTTRPETRAIAIDWTAWGGIGMASRGSIPKMMEMAGIDMLPPEAGIPLIRRELTAGGRRGELVAAQRLGILMKAWDPDGGIDGRAEGGWAGPMIGRVSGVDVDGTLTIETTLDPTQQPFLYDHRIGGTAVLPGVMGIEAFAEAALWMMPGWRVEAVEEVNFLAPFKFYRDEPRTASIQATLRPDGDGVIAECRLVGRRALPNGSEQETTHFAARVRLCAKETEAAQTGTPVKADGRAIEASDIYQVYFHGPAYQVVERAWRDNGQISGKLKYPLPVNHYPPERPLAMAPRLIELFFQTAGLWEMVDQGRMGLPQQLAEVRLNGTPKLGEQLYAVVTAHREEGSFSAEVVDAAGNRLMEMTGYKTVALPDVVDAERLRALAAAVS